MRPLLCFAYAGRPRYRMGALRDIDGRVLAGIAYFVV
jgi:hypothetical protein